MDFHTSAKRPLHSGTLSTKKMKMKIDPLPSSSSCVSEVKCVYPETRGMQHHSGSWHTLSALCTALTADTPTADYAVILEMAQRLTAVSFPQRFTVVPRPLCFYDGGERTNWTYDKADPGRFDYKACGNFSEFTTGARSRVMFAVAVFVTKRSTYVGLTADERRQWDGEPMHVWGALLVQLPRGQGKALAIYDCNVSSVDYAAPLQHVIGGRAVKLARKFRARGGMQVWRNPPDDVPNTAGECYSRTFNWLQAVLSSDPNTLATFTEGELTEIRGFRKMSKPM
ncbi:hypothetical protein B0H14DRAFT_3688404 [Mycena olivaceomarginata]|nr:hypothetical protein B0H14DRAFT_3688404 [Mycena olivaceomarginata]